MCDTRISPESHETVEENHINSKPHSKIRQKRCESLSSSLTCTFAILIVCFSSVQSTCVWQGDESGKLVCEFHQAEVLGHGQGSGRNGGGGGYIKDKGSSRYSTYSQGNGDNGFSKRKLDMSNAESSDGHDEIVNQILGRPVPASEVQVAHISLPSGDGEGRRHDSDLDEIHSILPNLLDANKIKKLLQPTRMAPSTRRQSKKEDHEINDENRPNDDETVSARKVSAHLETGSLGEYLKAALPFSDEPTLGYSKKKPFIQILDNQQQTDVYPENTKSTLLLPIAKGQQYSQPHGRDYQYDLDSAASETTHYYSSPSENSNPAPLPVPFLPLPPFPNPAPTVPEQYAPTQPYMYGEPSPLSAQEQYDRSSSAGNPVPGQRALFIPDQYAPTQPYAYSQSPLSSRAGKQHSPPHEMPTPPSYPPTQPYIYGEPSPIAAQQQYDMGHSDRYPIPRPTTPFEPQVHYAPTQPFPTQLYPSSYMQHHHQQYPEPPQYNPHAAGNRPHISQQHRQRLPTEPSIDHQFPRRPMFYGMDSAAGLGPANMIPDHPQFQYHHHQPNYIPPPNRPPPTQLKPVTASKVKSEKEVILAALKTLSQTKPELIKTIAQNHGLVGNGVIEIVSANRSTGSSSKSSSTPTKQKQDDDSVSLPIDQVLTLLLSNQKYSSTGKNYFKNSFTMEENSGTNNNPNELAQILYNMGILQRIAKGTLTIEQMELVNKLIDLNHQEKLLTDTYIPRKKPAKYIVPRATTSTRTTYNPNLSRHHHHHRGRDSDSDYFYRGDDESSSEGQSQSSQLRSGSNSRRRSNLSGNTKSYEAYADIQERYRASRNRDKERHSNRNRYQSYYRPSGVSSEGEGYRTSREREMLFDRPGSYQYQQQNSGQQQAARVNEPPVNLNIIIPPSSEQHSRHQPVFNDSISSGTITISHVTPPGPQPHQVQQQPGDTYQSPTGDEQHRAQQHESALLTPHMNAPTPLQGAEQQLPQGNAPGGLASLLFNGEHSMLERLRSEWWRGVSGILNDHVQQQQPYQPQGGFGNGAGVLQDSHIQHDESTNYPNTYNTYPRNQLNAPVIGQLLGTIGLLGSFIVLTFIGINLQKAKHVPRYRIRVGLTPGLIKPILLATNGENKFFNQTGHGPVRGDSGNRRRPNSGELQHQRPNSGEHYFQQSNSGEQHQQGSGSNGNSNEHVYPFAIHNGPPPSFQSSGQQLSSAEIPIDHIIKEKLLNDQHGKPYNLHLHIKAKDLMSSASGSFEHANDDDDDSEEDASVSVSHEAASKVISHVKPTSKSNARIPFDHSFVSYLKKANSLGLTNNPGLLQRTSSIAVEARTGIPDLATTSSIRHEQEHPHQLDGGSGNSNRPFGSSPLSSIGSTSRAATATAAVRAGPVYNPNNGNSTSSSATTTAAPSLSPITTPIPSPTIPTEILSTSSTSSSSSSTSTTVSSMTVSTTTVRSVSSSSTSSTNTEPSTSRSTTKPSRSQPKQIPVRVIYE